MSLASLKKHLTALKLELLSDADALHASGPIVHGHVQTPPRTSSRSSASHSRAHILRSPIGSPAALLGSPSAPDVNAEIAELQLQLREAREANDKLESENRMMHDALVAAKQTEAITVAQARSRLTLACIYLYLELNNEFSSRQLPNALNV